MRNLTQFAIRTAIAATLATTLAGCIGGAANNRQLESVHQPVVTRNNYTLDLAANPGGLSSTEQGRLNGWFEALGLRYGDRIALDDPMGSPSARADVEATAAQYGMLLSDTAPVTPGALNVGTVRVIVTRSTAEVPGCPDWAGKSETNLANATSTNYGCSINSNLAAMVANPEHLLKGARDEGGSIIATSSRAIGSYIETKPTGKDGLKKESTQNGK